MGANPVPHSTMDIRIDTILSVCLLCILTVNIVGVNAVLLCKVSMVKPSRYEWGTDATGVGVDIVRKQLTNDNKTTEQMGSFSTPLYYGKHNPPREPVLSRHTVKPDENIKHQFQTGFNGTHVCVAINQMTITSESGATRETCEQQCRVALDPDDPFSPMVYYINDLDPSTTTYRTATVVVSRAFPYLYPKCYDEKGQAFFQCDAPKPCVMSVYWTDTNSPPQFLSSCYSEELATFTNCTEPSQCLTDVHVPFIGNGTYAKVCTYCCQFNRCNDVRKCNKKDGKCDLYGDYVTTDSPDVTTEQTGGDGTAGVGRINTISTYITLLFFCGTIPYS